MSNEWRAMVVAVFDERKVMACNEHKAMVVTVPESDGSV